MRVPLEVGETEREPWGDPEETDGHWLGENMRLRHANLPGRAASRTGEAEGDMGWRRRRKVEEAG